jgi:hypothetical protein
MGGRISGTVKDQTGAALPGVIVEIRQADSTLRRTVTTDASGKYVIEPVAPGTHRVSFRLINFAGVSDEAVVVAADQSITLDATLPLAVSADVTVTGRRTFANLADVENPAENLVGVAFAASQRAVTAKQLEGRPIMRSGEVLETVPGLIISQHSGEGKANQYYLRGFNLDHGTDFATTVAGVPVNLPTNGHGHGYSDLNFLIPQLVSGVQYSNGPYFAEHGDFSAAGAANINYTNALDRPLLDASAGQDGWGRVLAAASPRVGQGHLLFALDANHNDGPWDRPDDYRRVNAVVRYSRGDVLSGLSLTAMGYHASWSSTDQVPERAIEAGTIGRFGNIDPTDGGRTSRYSLAFDAQRAGANSVLRTTAYAFRYDLSLFSNFTYFLDDPLNGDQFQQVDSRFVAGGRITYKRQDDWAGTRRHTRLVSSSATTTSGTSVSTGRGPASACPRFETTASWRPVAPPSTRTSSNGRGVFARRLVCGPTSTVSTWTATCPRTPVCARRAS